MIYWQRFQIQENTITRIDGSKMPYRTDTSFDTENNLAWYNLQSRWIVVTYTHKTSGKELIPLKVAAGRGDLKIEVVA